MNWDAIGAIGQLVSAIAVVVSLAYVGVQLRESNRVARFDSHVRARAIFTEHQKATANPQNSAIWLRGLREPESLSVEDLFRFYQMMYMLVNGWELQQLGPYGSYVSRSVDQRLVNDPGFRRWWTHARLNYSDAMIELVDEVLAQPNKAEGTR